MKLAEFDMQMFLMGFHKTGHARVETYKNNEYTVNRDKDKNTISVIQFKDGRYNNHINTREFHTAIEYLLEH